MTAAAYEITTASGVHRYATDGKLTERLTDFAPKDETLH